MALRFYSCQASGLRKTDPSGACRLGRGAGILSGIAVRRASRPSGVTRTASGRPTCYGGLGCERAANATEEGNRDVAR